MIGKTVLAALIAGLLAGLIYSAVQHVRTTPLIIAAEAYETALAHDHGAETTGEMAETPDAAHTEWAPANGWERTAATTVASMLTGAGFALALLGISLLSGITVSARNGLIWGLCGFLAVTLGPAAGLPPELPGMPAGDLVSRQIWWIGTILATGLGIYLIALQRSLFLAVLAITLIAAPHIVGAPQPVGHETAVPPGLAASFAANALAAAAIFWCLIGWFLGLALDTIKADKAAL
jgi:cobalt transporter subunit CbtA